MDALEERRPAAGAWAPVGEWSAEAPAGLAPLRRLVREAVTAELAVRPAEPPDGPVGAEPPVFASLAERVVLVAGELASNGLRHGLPPVAVWLVRHDSRWLVRATDEGGGVPSARPPDHTGGRGLGLVGRLSEAAGRYPEAGRTVVWAELHDTPPAAVRELRPSPRGRGAPTPGTPVPGTPTPGTPPGS